MLRTLMVGLQERDMQAVINTYNLNDFYYPTLFPLREQLTLSWKTLEGQTGLHIAGDLIARGASIMPKTREALARIQGDIPKIAVKRTMNEDELNEYKIMVAMTNGNADLRRLVEIWAEDTNYCWQAVASRLEWIALQSISRGRVNLSRLNNVSIVTEYDLDYQLGNKRVGYQSGSAAWSNKSAAHPITRDFKMLMSNARANAIYPRFAFMNPSTFAKMAETDEVVKMSASFAANALDMAYTPSLQKVNSALSSLAYLYGLQIVLIDQQITIELEDGSRKSENPFADDVVMFSESRQLGNTYWMRPADMDLQGTAAIKAMNGHTCVKKYSEEEPIREVTIGVANAIPAWATSQRSYLMDVEHASWIDNG